MHVCVLVAKIMITRLRNRLRLCLSDCLHMRVWYVLVSFFVLSCQNCLFCEHTPLSGVYARLHMNTRVWVRGYVCGCAEFFRGACALAHADMGVGLGVFRGACALAHADMGVGLGVCVCVCVDLFACAHRH